MTPSFILALGTKGRKHKALTIDDDSFRKLSEFARDLGIPVLTLAAAMAALFVARYLAPV